MQVVGARRHVHPDVAHGTVEGAAIDGCPVEGFAAGVGVDHGNEAGGITAQLDITLFFELELGVLAAIIVLIVIVDVAPETAAIGMITILPDFRIDVVGLLARPSSHPRL